MLRVIYNMHLFLRKRRTQSPEILVVLMFPGGQTFFSSCADLLLTPDRILAVGRRPPPTTSSGLTNRRLRRGTRRPAESRRRFPFSAPSPGHGSVCVRTSNHSGEAADVSAAARGHRSRAFRSVVRGPLRFSRIVLVNVLRFERHSGGHF